MSASVPSAWFHDPPSTLVAGDGPYAVALATVLGTEVLHWDCLHRGPQSDQGGPYPQVLQNLARVLLVTSETMPAAEALQGHESVWAWITKLATDGDQHELAFLFILPPDTSKGFEDALAAGLSLDGIVPATTGHAVWRRSGSLQELIEVLSQTHPMDLVALKARRAADCRHSAVTRLREATGQRDFALVRDAVREVLAAFSGREYLLDIFCASPSHQNGNMLRGWLRKVVAEPVTPEAWLGQKQQVAACLDRGKANSMK